jgi:hypothetical protein
MSPRSSLGLGALTALVAVTALALVLPATASAQEPADDEVRAAEISYEIGDFDGEQDDWPIVAVEVRGTLDTEQSVTVELWGADERLWMGTVGVTQPVTRLEVIPFVAIGDLVEVGIWQQLTPVESIEILPPGTPEPPPPDPPEEPEDEVIEEADLPPTDVVGERLERADVEILGGASGGSGSGQLALSMILAIVVLAIVFRTPLPSSSTQRWTK